MISVRHWPLLRIMANTVNTVCTVEDSHTLTTENLEWPDNLKPQEIGPLNCYFQIILCSVHSQRNVYHNYRQGNTFPDTKPPFTNGPLLRAMNNLPRAALTPHPDQTKSQERFKVFFPTNPKRLPHVSSPIATPVSPP